MDLSKIVKKNIAGTMYYTDDKKYYTEYKLSPRDQGHGLIQIANENKDKKGNVPNSNEILRLNNGVAEQIADKNKIGSDWTLLLPSASPF
jgi:hypothetical protein